MFPEGLNLVGRFLAEENSSWDHVLPSMSRKLGTTPLVGHLVPQN